MPFIQLQFRRDLSSNWISNNPTLAPGELGIETDTNLFKIGSGVDWVGTTYGGLQGVTGDTGATGTILFAGAWDINATYNQNDLVSDNGSMYYWLSSTSGNSASSPSTDLISWGTISLPGPTGAAGETGATGETGPTGTFEFSGVGGEILFYDGGVTGNSKLTWDNVNDNLVVNGQFFSVDASGNVGIDGIITGPAAGNFGVDLDGNTTTTGIKDSTGSLGMVGQVLTSTYVDTPSTASLLWQTLSAGPTGATGAILGLGNVLIVDQVYGNDLTASMGGLPYQTVEAAITATSGTTGTTVWIMPGTYNLTAGLILPNGIALRGLNTQTCTIQMIGVITTTTLLTMGENCRVEDLSLKLTSDEDQMLVGINFPGTSSQTSKLRTSVLTVDNSTAAVGSINEMYGILCSGTGTFSESTFSFNCIKGSTINVKSNGGGAKIGILVSNTNQVSIRDTNIYVAAPTDPSSTGSYIGVQTVDPLSLGSIQIRSSSIGAPKQLIPKTFTSSDILQVTPSTITNPTYLALPGIQIGPGVDLVTKSAGGKSFTTYNYPTTLYYGLRGLIKDGAAPGVTGYLWPGTQAASSSFPDITIPAAYYRVQQPLILSGINIHSNTPTSANGETTFFVFRSPGGTGITMLADFTAGFTATQTDFSYYNSSQDFAAGDFIHVGVVQTGGGNNNTMGDITIQLDMF